MSIIHVEVGWVTDLQNRYLEMMRIRLFLLIYFIKKFLARNFGLVATAPAPTAL